MPVVNKQSLKAQAKQAGLASRIRPVGSTERGIKLCVYGRGKTGKTRFACTFPKPLLIAGTEDGTLSVSTTKGVDFVAIRASAEIDEAVELVTSRKYATLVLDTAGGLQDLILKEILGLEDIPVQKSWGMAKQQDWGTCGAQTKERLRALIDQADRGATNVVIIAHERNFDTEMDSELIFPTVGAALTPSVAGWLNAACDYVCQTFIRQEVEEQKIKIGNKVSVQKKKTENIQYCLRIGPHPVYMTGFRVPDGVEIPEAIVDPHYDKIAKLIRGK